MAETWDSWDYQLSQPFDWDTPPTSDSAWDSPKPTACDSSGAAAWDAVPDRPINQTSNPHAVEFPGTFTWTASDELTSSIIRCNTGSVTYLRGSELGVGGFARVYKALRQSDSRLFAGKTSTVVQKLIDEERVLRRWQHEHILRCEGWYAEEGKPETTMLLTELCAGGNLHEFINERCKAMEVGMMLRVMGQVAGALDYLHKQDLFHSDVKPKNIFIRSFSPMDVVLGDCADIKPVSYRGELLGTPGYYSPEIIATKKHAGCADDVWALGITMLGMMDQWPRVMYTRETKTGKDKRRIEKYPEQCWEHARDLRRLNGGNRVVKLLEGMMAWGVKERVRAGDLKGQAEALLGAWDGREDLRLIVPEGFEQISFW